jgi:hypothetical protein
MLSPGEWLYNHIPRNIPAIITRANQTGMYGFIFFFSIVKIIGVKDT